MAPPAQATELPRHESSAEDPRRGSGRWRTRGWQFTCFVAVLVVWALVSGLGLISREALPTPWSVLRSLAHLLVTLGFWQAVGDTLRGALVGLAFAVAIGVPLGLVTGTYAAAEQASRLLVDFLRSFPVIALLPVFLLILGSTPRMKSTVVFLACLFPVFLQAQYGARSVTPMIAETIRSYRIPRLLRFAKVILPSATPSIMTGVRLAATTSVLVAIGVEILSTLPGIGHEVTQEQQAGAAANAYAYILVSGLLGYGINRGSELIESALLRWRPPAHTG
jgi:ABC-type nitrate/sulfonate/bicarbonate transport system permease component